jgi:protein-tyrosine phosphatase
MARRQREQKLLLPPYKLNWLPSGKEIKRMIHVLFVCLGNICRSPMAEGVFKDRVAKAGLSDQFCIDSVGTSNYHIGDLPHPGTRRILAAHGISADCTARQINRADLLKVDYIVAMDRENIADLHSLSRNLALDKPFHLLLDFAENSPVRDVPDPYYTGDFEGTHHLVEAGCQGLLAHIRREEGI